MIQDINEQENTEQVPKSSGIQWAIAFIFIIVFFIVVGAFYATPDKKIETLSYNNFEFQKISGLWHTQWQRENNLYTIPLRFNPKELEIIPVTGKLTSNFNRNQIYITFDPRKGNFSMLALSAAELSTNMNQVWGLKPIAACIVNETDACSSVPIITCNTPNVSVIYLREGPKPGIVLKDECVELLGSGFDLVKSTERLIYQWYGIMK